LECYELKKNYFEKIIKYTKKVFNIERSLSKLTDARKNPKYRTNQVVLVVLLGFIMRVRSFNELNNMIKDNDFRKVIPRGKQLAKIDVIRDVMKVIDIGGLREMLAYGIKSKRKQGVRWWNNRWNGNYCN
jgi:hypothetical protein